MDQIYNEVLFEEKNGVGKVILNRPKQMNTLTYEMLSRILSRLRAFEESPDVKLLVFKGNGRVFCAGGDLKSLLSAVVNGHWSFGANYYRGLLSIIYTIGTYQKPVVAIMDGIVMGGGAGLSIHSTIRIVTENTKFAMPEAAIGHFPDCGATHFLSRLPGFFGEYLGLTGSVLDGKDMVGCGFATHFVLSKDLHAVEDAINSLEESDGRLDVSTISEAINIFVPPHYLKNEISVDPRLSVINKCFGKETVEEILLSLEEEYSATQEQEKWILQAINSIKSASPTSVKVFLALIRQGRRQNLKQCLVHEFRAACHTFRKTVNGDAYEGVRVILVNKSKHPKWMPSELEQVSSKMVKTYFSDVEDDDDWVPLQLPARSTHMEALPHPAIPRL